MAPGSTTPTKGERTLLPDGGEAEAEATEDQPSEGEGESEATEDQPAEDEAESEAAGEEEEEESEAAGEEEEEEESATNVLYLDLEGLFLDLLGLEVDLEEVELQVEAVTGEGNLLGNLLSAVAGLLDSAGGGLRGLLGRVLGFGSGEGPSIVQRIGGGIRKTVREAVEDIPVQKLLTQLVTGLVQQLVEKPEEPEAEAPEAEA